jgi:hypothetical protein
MFGRDGIAALVILAASAVLYAATLGLHENPLVPIGPAFYPRIVLGITAALSAALLVADFFEHRRRPAARAAAPAARADYRLVTLLFVAFGLYVVVMPHLGFRIATFAFLLGAQALLEPPRGARRVIVVFVVAAVATAVVYLVFELYLTVLLPRGRWTDW